jgi:hypothetical protein
MGIRGIWIAILSILVFLPWCAASSDDLNRDAVASAAANDESSRSAEDQGDDEENRQKAKQVDREVHYVSENCYSVTGFYGGGSLGFESVKNQFKKTSGSGSAATTGSSDKIKKSNSSLVAAVFGGYNFQVDKIVFGLECSVNVKPSKAETEVEFDSVKRDVSARRRYSFGLCPRVGYNLFGSLVAYVKLGTDITKYNVRSKNKTDSTAKESKKNSHKTVIQTAIGVEQHFGQWFVRGEFSKFFGKHVGTVDGAKVTSGSWGGLVGAGYRF